MKEITNIADVVSYHADVQPDSIAVYFKNKSISYKLLDDYIWRTATYLAQNNIASNDVIGLTFKNDFYNFITILAVARIGATSFSLPRTVPNTLREELIKKTDIKVILGERSKNQKNSYRYLKINSEILISADIDYTVRSESPTAPWTFIHGSGSTGKSKLIPVTHVQQIRRMVVALEWLSSSSKNISSSLVHIDHYSSKILYLQALMAGSSIALVLNEYDDPVKVCNKYNVSILYMTVFHIQNILKYLPKNIKNAMPCVKALIVDASEVPDKLRHEILNRLTPNLYVRYGINEVGTVTVSKKPQVYTTPATVGYPLESLKVEIVDKNHNLLPANHIGEIRIKSSTNIDNYIDDEEATKKAFKDDWFYPHDLGKITEEGQLIYMGRSDHMMIINGINIYPAEIERAMSTHPDIEDAAAMPIPSKEHQDMPVCAVVLKNGSKIIEQKLLDYSYERLGSASPHRVIILNEIPRNDQGKLIRKELKMAIENKINKRTVVNKKAPLIIQMDIERPFSIIIAKNKIPTDLSLLDKWFNDVMKINVEIKLKDKALLYQLSWCILLLSSRLAQAVRIPQFDPGKVIDNKFNPLTKKYKVLVDIDTVEYFEKRIFHEILFESANIVLNHLSKPINYKNTQQLFQQINKKVLRPFRRVSNSRKSTIPVLREAYKLNIPIIHLGSGVYQLGHGSKAQDMDGSTTQYDSAMGAKLSQNKMTTSNLIRNAGLPAPKNELARSKKEALNAAKKLGWPIVVKPLDQDRGEGITVDVNSEAALYKAFEIAKRASNSSRVIIESQVKGICQRVFIANGKLLYAVKRLPKSVIGDGVSNINELIYKSNLKENNNPPWLKTELFPMDNMAIKAIHDAGFSIYDVLTKGVVVPLRDIESTKWGGHDKDVTDSIHPDNIEIAIRAAKLFRLNVSGVDIITPDISVPWYENGAIINEVNFSPLFGLGDISRRAIPRFFNEYIDGDGRIGIKAFIGNPVAMVEAIKHQAKMNNKNIRSIILSQESCFDYNGKEMRLDLSDLSKRIKALYLNSTVDEIVLVVNDIEELSKAISLNEVNEILNF